MDRKEKVLLMLKPKVKAFGFNKKELMGIAAKIADNLTSADDASDEDVNAEIEERIAVGDNRRELIEQYTNLEHLTREIVEILIDYIVIGKRIPGTKDVPIEIHWNF